MFDAQLREQSRGLFERLAEFSDRSYISPDLITYSGLALGIGGAISTWYRLWMLALVLWLASRIADGLDGALARRRVVAGGTKNPAGGYLDIMADFAVYGSFVLGVAHGSGKSYLPFLFVLLAYYLNGTSFLAFSSIGEKEGIRIDDGRSLSFLFGLAEATETIVVHSAWCLFPSRAGQIAGIWAAIVFLSAFMRFYRSHQLLSRGGGK